MRTRCDWCPRWATDLIRIGRNRHPACDLHASTTHHSDRTPLTTRTERLIRG